MEIVLFANEDRVFFHAEHYVEIARRTAVGSVLPFTGETQAGTGVNTGRDIDLQLSFRPEIAVAAALLARTADDLPAAAALAAGSAHRQETLLENHLAAAMAHRAGDDAVFGFGAIAIATAALLEPGNLDVGGHAVHGVFEIDLEIVANVFAALGPIAPPARRLPPKRSPNPKKSPRMSLKSWNADGSNPRPRRAGYALMAEPVIGRALLRITQDTICFGGFLELLFGLAISGIAIRMVLQRKFTVRTLERLDRRHCARRRAPRNSLVWPRSFRRISSRILDHRDFMPSARRDSHTNHRRAEQSAFEVVAPLVLLENRVIFGLFRFHAVDRLVDVRIERLPY